MYLAIDTISSNAGVSVFDLDKFEHTPLNPKMASEGIIESIDQTLKMAGADLGDLKGVFVIKGPGSFTGLRVGISVANQFAHQLKIPILGVKTHEWWGLRAPSEVVYLQTMNREEFYLSDKEGPRIVPVESLEKMGERQWMGELKFDHAEKVPTSFSLYSELLTPQVTWMEFLKKVQADLKVGRSYDLVEPFYGKEPKITTPKKAN